MRAVITRTCAAATLISATLFSNGTFASKWVPISVGDITTFVPLPSIEGLDSANFSQGSTVAIKVGSTSSTQAYYYRSLDQYGQYGTWQCQTGQQVTDNDEQIIDENVSAGEYRYQVSACMTGAGCDLNAFNSDALACSEQVLTARIDVLDNSGTRQPNPTSTINDVNVGTTGMEFRVSESGAATYNLPIAIPAGSAGVQPQVSLNYSSQSGDGYLGRGWNISGLAAISRCPKTFAQDGKIDGVKFSSSDRLCLNGQRLIIDGKTDDKSTSDATYWSSAARYHTETDSYTKVTPHYSGSALKGFTVQNKAGEVHYYGDTSAVSGSSLAGKALATSFKSRTGSVDSGADAFVETKSNAAIAKMWAIKAIKDIKNNYILYRYIENKSLGEHYIDEIQYTGNSSLGQSPYAWIKFHYGLNRKVKSGWQSGQPHSLTKLLTSVEVKIDDEQHRKYNLGYYTSTYLEERNYLESVTECVGAVCLKPVTFDWLKKPAIVGSVDWYCPTTGRGYAKVSSAPADPESSRCFSLPSNTAFKPFSTNTNKITNSKNPWTAKVIDINGDGYADIVYVDGSSWKVKLGPNYGTTEVLYTGKTAKPEYALIFDYNGDGVLDLLIADKATDKWTILSYDTNAFSSIETHGNCNHECWEYTATKRTKLTTVPATGLLGKTQILDVDGDALGDIVMASGRNLLYYRNLGAGEFSGASTLISLPASSAVPRFDQSSVKQTASLKNASGLDVNGDGRSDILFSEQTTVYQCRVGNRVFPIANRHECEADLQGTWSSHSSTAWKLYVSTGGSNYQLQQVVSTSQSFEPRVTDLNGDGLSDLMWLQGGRWYYKLSNGVEFLGTKTAYINGSNTALATTDANKNYAVFTDLTSDGRTDLLVPNSSATSWTTYFSRPLPEMPDEVIFESRGSYAFNKNRSIQFGDRNGDGKIDLFQSDGGWYIHLGGLVASAEDVIQASDNGFGVRTTLTYGNITDKPFYYADDSSNRYDSAGNVLDDYFSPKSAYFAVKEATTQTNVGASNRVKYQYGGLLIHKNGRGMLGFERVRTTDLQSNVMTETIYAQKFPYTGMPLSTTQRIGLAGPLLSEAENVLTSLLTASKARFPYIKSSTETSYALAEDLLSSSALSTTSSSFTYDSYGNVSTSTITEKDASNPTKNYRKTTTVNTYGTTGQYKQLGRLTYTGVVKTLYTNGSAVSISPGNSAISRTSSFTYNNDLMLKTETVEPNNSAVKIVTTNGYDSFGNKSSTSSLGASGKNGSLQQIRSGTATFDSRGRYQTSASNGLGHQSETVVIGTKGEGKGRTTQVYSTDANGITKTTKVDVFGNAYQSSITGEGSDDPTLVSKTYRAFCSTNGVNCSALGYIRVIEASAGAPEKQTFIDKWGRTIESRVQAFDGTWSVTAQTYNSDGLPSTVSEPGKGGASTYVTTMHYDKLRRVTKEVKPRGIVSRSYDGATVKTIGETGLIQKETKNYLGQTSQVTNENAAGVKQTKLTYTYTANDELLSASVFAGDTLSHTQVRNQYDDFGRKVQMTDADKGTWKYAYNAFGELVEQTNSSNQISLFSYDELGRKVYRRDGDGYTDWQYDENTNSAVAANGKTNRIRYFKGKSSASGTPNYQENYTYASHGKVLSTAILLDGENFNIEQGYDAYNRPYYTSYPANNFTVKQTYTSLGYPQKIENATQGHRDFGKAYETILAMNSRGQVTSKRLGNNVVETATYEARTGWLNYLEVAKGSTNHHALDYSYYDNGNLKTRSNIFAFGGSATNYTDTFTYDGLNRLWTAKKTGGISASETFLYDKLGNLKNKANTVLKYTGYKGASKNQLTEVWRGSTRTHLFEYDPRGNVLKDAQRTFAYTAFDKPYLITKGTTKSEFSYGPNRELYRQRLTVGGKVTDTLYVKGLYERAKLASGVTEHKYHVGNVVVTDRSNGANDTLYLHKDNLGSTVSITNSAGNIVQHFNYDAWGKQNAFYANASLTAYVSPATSDGYTGHKMINDLNIIHMNGRIYDPTLGRFLQADPHIQAPMNSQSYNRYSYVLNNPMSYTDPSGYFFKSLFKAVKKYWRVIAAAAVTYFTAGAAAGWAAGWGLTGATAGAVSGAIAGAAGGFVATGSLRGALTGAFSGAAFGAIGASFDAKSGFWETNGVGHIGSHAVAGGIMSDLQGGKFGHGFFSAGLTKGINVNGMIGSFGAAYDAARIAVSAVIGGTISKITGGKFANGAVTAGFAQMLNGNSQIKGAANNPIGERFPGAAKVKMADGKYYWVDKQTYDRNFGSDYLAQQTGTNMSDYNETTKQEVINAATVVATVTGFGGLALGSARLGYAAIGSGFFAWSLEPSAEGLGWLAVDAATMRMGPLLNGTLFEGLDHAVGSYSWLHQTANAVQTCQVPLRCQ